MNAHHQNAQDIARHQWHYILPSIGIEAHFLRDTHQPCPLCGGKDRFRYDNKDGNGTYFCNQCGAGNGYTLMQKHLGISFLEAVQIVKNLLGYGDNQAQTPSKAVFRQPESHSGQPASKDRLARLMRIWRETEPLNDFALAYYQTRGLDIAKLPQTAAIRFAPSLAYWTNDTNGKSQHFGNFPCIVAAIKDQAGQLQGLHLTYLQPRGKAKLNAPHPQTGEPLPAKKMQSRFSGSLKGASVQIEPPNADGAIIIAEGIETALAARELFDLPIQAALSAKLLEQWQAPQNAKHVLIIADHDTPRDVGFQAALHLANRLQKQGLTVQIWQPETQGMDALDELNQIKQRINAA